MGKRASEETAGIAASDNPTTGTSSSGGVETAGGEPLPDESSPAGEINWFRGEYSWLSNFHPVEIRLEDGLVYPTVEHAFQASKTDDPAERERLRQQATPGGAKRAGKKVTLRPDWEVYRLEAMKRLVRQKFQHPELRAKLLATGECYLREGSVFDRFWGQAPGRNGRWSGQNQLGRILMEVRDEIRRQAAPSG